MADFKDSHAQEFTDIERQVLRLWFDLDQAGNDQLADALLNAGLQLEHYVSTLDHDPDKRSPGDIAHTQLLAFRLSEQVSLAEEFLQHKAGTPNPPAEATIRALRGTRATLDTIARWEATGDKKAGTDNA